MDIQGTAYSYVSFNDRLNEFFTELTYPFVAQHMH